MEKYEQNMDRRTAMALGVAGLAGLSGCTGLLGGSEEPGQTPKDTQTDTPTETETAEETPTDTFDPNSPEMDDDRLFVLDMIGASDETAENVFGSRNAASSVLSALKAIRERTGDAPVLSLVNANAAVNQLGAADARTVRYAQDARWLRLDDRPTSRVCPRRKPLSYGETCQNRRAVRRLITAL